MSIQKPNPEDLREYKDELKGKSEEELKQYASVLRDNPCLRLPDGAAPVARIVWFLCGGAKELCYGYAAEELLSERQKEKGLATRVS
jgi:hypothetical protein